MNNLQKWTLFFVFACVVGGSAIAQTEPEQQTLSLEDCVRIALGRLASTPCWKCISA